MYFGDDIYVWVDCIVNGGYMVVVQMQDFIGERFVEVLLVLVVVVIYCDGIYFYCVIVFVDGGQCCLCILFWFGQYIFIVVVFLIKL